MNRYLTMNFHRSEGKLDKNKILKRMQTLMNMVYLSAEHQEDGSFKISSEIMKSIETELDFSPPEIKTKKAKEEEIKKRYRQRDSYRFWKETLDRANIKTAPEAKDFLMGLYDKLERVRYFGSISHSNYALETLNLAIDDIYGTSSLVLHQYKHNLNKPKKVPKKSLKSKKATPTTPSNNDFSPF
tara:strand:- start:667 stop:1221 length:555 start_codon:yes stop_codon:yes gene_type:complete